MKALYPPIFLPTLWRDLDTLQGSGRLFSPQQVYEELKKWDDDLFKWVQARRNMFSPLDGEQVAVTQDVLAAFPTLIDPQKETADADPFVIALAIVQNRNLALLGDRCIVVSHEKPSAGGRAKIPNVCDQYNLTHLRLIDFFKNEGWRY